MPYQLQACTAGQVEERLDASELETAELEDRIEELEIPIDEDERELDDTGVLDTGVDDWTLEDVAVPQIGPVTGGVSIAPPLAFTCKPKDTFWPGWIVPFQLRLVAEYGLEPPIVEFQLPDKRLVT